MTRSHRAVLVVLAVVLVGLPAVGAVAGSPAASLQASSDSGNLTLEQLRDGGEQAAGRAPSTRWLSESSNVWVDYPHVNPLQRSSGESWQAGQILESGETVRTDTLRFHFTGPRGLNTTQKRLKIAYWEVGTREVQTANGTVERQYAKNVTTETKTLEFSGSAGVSEVDLRSHFDRPVRVTMWIPGNDGARWTFEHHTMRTEQAVSTDTAGERIWWVLKEYVLWVVGLGFAAVAAIFGAKRRAGAGPQKGYVWWLIVLSIGGFAIGLFAYGSIAEALVDAPQILAVVTVGLLSIPLIEADRDLDKWMWIKPELIKSVTASGGEAVDSVKFTEDIRRVVRMPSGKLAVVEPGLLKFVARLFGGAAHLEGVEDMPTESRAIGRSGIDKIAWTSATAEKCLDYAPEGWHFEIPDTARELIPLGVAAIALATVGQFLVGTTALGVLALPLLALRPHAGTASFEAANAMQRAAYVTSLYAAIEHQEAATLKESREKRLREKAKNQKDVEEALESKDATLLEEAVSDVDPQLLELGDGALGELDEDDGDDESDDGDSEPVENEKPAWLDSLLGNGGEPADD